MSKRRANCEHLSWDVKGTDIQCRDCGDTIDRNDVENWLRSDGPITIHQAETILPKPLTAKLKTAHLDHGGTNGNPPR